MKSNIALLVISSLLLLGFSLASLPGKADKNTIVVFVNKNIAVDALSIDEVKRLFLKERMTMKDGTTAVPVNAKIGSALRKVFGEKVLGMNPSDEARYWQVQKIRRGVLPATEFNNTQKAVFTLKGGIGYCFESDYIATINKVVLKL